MADLSIKKDTLGPDGDKGDATVGGSGTTLTIDDNAVTFAKMQDISTDTIIGRDTAGTGDPEELSASQVRTILGTPSGSGTTNVVPKWTGTSTLGDSAASSPDANTVKIGDAAGTELTLGNNWSGVDGDAYVHVDGNLVLGRFGSPVIRMDGNGVHVPTENVTIGHGNAPTTISASASMFAGVTPKAEIDTGSDAETYEKLVVIRSGDTSANAVLRRLGLLLKLDSEGSSSASNKMGGLVLDSSSAFSNSPDLSLVTSNTKRLTITQAGAVSVSGGLTMGDSSGDGHRINGTLNLQGTAGSDGQVITLSGGLPMWLNPAYVAPPAGTIGVTELADDLDLSGNGTTTVGDFRGHVQQVGTTGTINDLALDADAAIVEFTGAGAVTLNGVAGGADGRLVMLVNRTGNDIIVVNEAGGSTAANRLTTVGTLNWYIPANAHGWIEYNGSSSRWIGENHYRSYAVSTVTSLGVGTNATVNGTLTVGGTTTLNGNATVGNATSDTLTVNATTTLSATKGVVQTSTGGSGTLNDLALDDNALVLNLNYGTLTLTGITGGVDGRVLILFSQGTSTVTLSNDTGSSAANRFYTENGAGQTLYAKGCAVLVYSGTLSRWVVSIRNRFPLLTVDGTATLNGNTTLGNATTDVVTFNGHADGAALLIGRQVITASGTYTPTAGTYKVRLQAVGGGGGGGGTTDATSAAGGGGGGGYIEKWIDPGAAITGGSVTIGAAGAGGGPGDVAGGFGGDTTIVIQGVTYTAAAGVGGSGGSLGLGGVSSEGDNAASSGSLDISTGTAGEPSGETYNGGTGFSGRGGNSPFGTGGRRRFTALPGDGHDATGHGAGGGGAMTVGAPAQTGGDGSAGVVIVWEYR